MAYYRELDDLPWEMRQGEDTPFSWWPKIAGRNVLASLTAGEVTYDVRDPQGVSVQSGNATVTDVDIGDRDVSRIDVSVTGLSTLDEGYQVRSTWRERAQTLDRFEARAFDVVLWPFRDSQVSFNDIVGEDGMLRDVLDREGVRRGYTAGEDAQEYAAGIVAERGTRDVIARIRQFVHSDGENARPALILDRHPLKRLILFTAVMHAWRDIAKQPEDGDDIASQRYRLFRQASDDAWLQMSPLKFDRSEDLVVDEEVSDAASIIHHRRIQA